MIVILAGCEDELAKFLVARWFAFGAELLTPKDLSASGWRHHQPTINGDTAVINGRKVPIGDIAGVLSRLPWVCEEELVHIVPRDRSYVASEITAFLLSWLSGLNCPVLNRPTPTCLSGPGWRPERWVHLAARLGIPVCPARRRCQRQVDDSRALVADPYTTVSVICEHCIGSSDPCQVDYAKRLSAATGVDLLAVHFSQANGMLLGADTWPDVSSAHAADAILEYFSGIPTC